MKMIEVSDMRVKPFRLLAVIMAIMVAVEIIAILRTPTYDKELEQAEKNYYLVKMENEKLKTQASRIGYYSE